MCDQKTSMIVGTIAGGFLGGVPGAALGASLGSTLNPDKAPDVPKLMPTPTMPTMDSASIAKARELSVAKLMSMGGRSSTILSQPSDVLGG